MKSYNFSDNVKKSEREEVKTFSVIIYLLSGKILDSFWDFSRPKNDFSFHPLQDVEIIIFRDHQTLHTIFIIHDDGTRCSQKINKTLYHEQRTTLVRISTRHQCINLHII